MLAGAILGFIAALNVNSALGYSYEDIGSYFAQTLNYCAAGSIIAAIISLKQWLLLRRKVKISLSWINTLET